MHDPLALSASLFTAMFQLQILNKEQLYRELGYATFTECCEEEYGLDQDTLSDWFKIIDKFFPKFFNQKELHELNKAEVTKLLETYNFTSSYGAPIDLSILAVLADLPKECTENCLLEKSITINGLVYTNVQIQILGLDTVKELVRIHLKNNKG